MTYLNYTLNNFKFVINHHKIVILNLGKLNRPKHEYCTKTNNIPNYK